MAGLKPGRTIRRRFFRTRRKGIPGSRLIFLPFPANLCRGDNRGTGGECLKEDRYGSGKGKK